MQDEFDKIVGFDNWIPDITVRVVSFVNTKNKGSTKTDIILIT